MQGTTAISGNAAAAQPGVTERQRWIEPHEAAGADQRRRDFRAMVSSVAGISYRVIDAGLKLLIIPIATRLLGIEEYGVWLTANAVLSLLMVSDFGIGSGVVNAVGGALAENDVATARSYVSTAYAAFGALALYLAATVTWLSHTDLLPRWLGIENKPLLIADSRELLLVLGLLISAAAFSNVITFLVSSLQEGYLAHCALIAASVAALFSIFSLRTRSLSHFALASSLPILAVYVLLTLYVFGVRHRNLMPRLSAIKMSSFRVIWRDGSRLLIAQIADTVVAFTSSVLVARYLGASHVPEVSVSLQVMMIVNYVACMFLLPLWPAYVEADKRDDHAWIVAAFRRGAWRSMTCIVVAALAYTFIYRQFIHRWSSLLPIPRLAFVLFLGCWFLIYIWNKNAMVLLNALGLTGVRARVAPLAAIVFVGTAALMLPHFGTISIPVAGCISSLLEACFTSTRAFRLLRERRALALERSTLYANVREKKSTRNEQCWVVVHDAWRDRYQLPAAFAETGMLRHFVTDWYTPADKPLWALLTSPLSGAALGLRTRFSSLVSSSLASDRKGSFLAGLIRRKISGSPFDDIVEGAKGGRRAAAKANAAGAHLLAASYSAAEAFAGLRPGLSRVLFQVHPQPRFLRDLYQTQMAASDDYSGLASEAEFCIDEAGMQAWEREARLADHILCASSFTKRSLCWSGIDAERISVVPYGVDTEVFRPSSVARGDTFKVLFVGQRVARKGLRALLRVWKQLAPANAELVLAGGHQADSQLIAGFEGIYTDAPRMKEQALIQLYQSADLFVLPSLAEGFGHVYLEALACGTPVLCTENTGAADLVVAGESGWILPAGDASALEAQLHWILNHRDDVRAMRPAARACAEQYRWSAFRESVRTISSSVAAVAEARARTSFAENRLAEQIATEAVGMIATTYQNALIIDFCTLLLCAVAAFRCTSSFLHPAAMMLGAHTYIVTLRLTQLVRGYAPMSYSFTWPLNEAEITRGVFASDAALVAMAMGWLIVHFWGRRGQVQAAQPRILLSDARVRFFAVGALICSMAGMAILGPHAQRSVTGDHSGGTSGYLLATAGWAGWCCCLLIYRYGFNWALSLFTAVTLLLVMLLSTFRGAVIIPCVFLLFVWLSRREKRGLPWAVLPALVCLWLVWLPMKPTVYALQQGKSPADALGVGIRTAFTNFGSDHGSGIDFQFLDMVSSTMTLVDVHDGFFYGGSISPLFVSPIPRQLWEAKPELNQYQFELDIPSRAMAKLHMTAGLIGESYADFGYFGVVLIPFAISVAFSAAYRRLFGTSLLTPGCLLYFIYLSTYMQLYRDGLISAVWFPFVHCAPVGFAAVFHWIWPPRPQAATEDQACFPSSVQTGPVPC